MPDQSFPRQQARTRRFTLGAPRAFRISPDGRRVTFLRSTAGDDPVNRLWMLDVDSGVESMVADPDELLGDADGGHLPPEERARRERARESGSGIVAYVTDTAVTGAVFALAGRLYSTDLDAGETARLPSADGVFDPRPSPTGSHVAYVAAGSLHVTSLEGDTVVAAADGPLTYGLAEFVAAEEMRRSRGYWWDPTGERLLVARVDVSPVARWHIGSPVEPWTEPTVIRYPAAGSANAVIGLELRRLDGAAVDVDWNPAGEWEYLVDAGWAPRRTPWIVVQTRDQRTCAVLDIDVDRGTVDERYRWRDDTWIDIVVGAPAWIGERLLTVEDRGAARRVVVDGVAITADALQVRQVVASGDDGVIVLATSEDPTATQVVHVGLDGSITTLTDAPGIHVAEAVAAAPESTMVISAASMDHDGWRSEVRVAGTRVAGIEDRSEVPCLVPEVRFHRVGGRSLATGLVLPRAESGIDPTASLPVLLDPYGGPHAQRVQAARGAFGASQWFADQGFAVVVTDGRGTPGRGPAFERAVAGDLAGPVLEDQLDALDALAELEPRLDLERVAIRGWSFGGYLAALAVLRRPDRIHAAIAGAPVTDWRLYDTHYTERYLGHPAIAPEAYERTDLTVEAASLERPLLLIHGLADDNVVAAHTLALSRALLEAGRPHQVLPLSGVTHMTPQEVVAENLLILQLEFLRTALGLRSDR